MECGYNWLFLFVFHTSSTKLSRRDPLLWTSLTEASFLKKKRKEKKNTYHQKKVSFFLIKKKIGIGKFNNNFFPSKRSSSWNFANFFSSSFSFHGIIFIVVNCKCFVVYGVAINGIETNRSNEQVYSNRVVSIVSHHRVWLTRSKPQKHRIQVVTSKTAFRSTLLPLCSPLTRKPLPGDHLDRIVICFPPWNPNENILVENYHLFTREKIKISIPFEKMKMIKNHQPIIFNFYCIQRFISIAIFILFRQQQKKFQFRHC